MKLRANTKYVIETRFLSWIAFIVIHSLWNNIWPFSQLKTEPYFLRLFRNYIKPNFSIKFTERTINVYTHLENMAVTIALHIVSISRFAVSHLLLFRIVWVFWYKNFPPVRPNQDLNPRCHCVNNPGVDSHFHVDCGFYSVKNARLVV